MLDCGLKVSKWVQTSIKLLHSLSDNYPWKRYECSYPSLLASGQIGVIMLIVKKNGVSKLILYFVISADHRIKIKQKIQEISEPYLRVEHEGDNNINHSLSTQNNHQEPKKENRGLRNSRKNWLPLLPHCRDPFEYLVESSRVEKTCCCHFLVSYFLQNLYITIQQ